MSSIPTELNSADDLRELVRVLGLKRSGGEDNLPEAGVDDRTDYSLLADRITRGRVAGRRRPLRIALLAAAVLIGMIGASVGIMSSISSPAVASPPMLSYEFDPSALLAGSVGAQAASGELADLANGISAGVLPGAESTSRQVVLTTNWTSIADSRNPASSRSELLNRITALYPDGSMEMYEAPGNPIGEDGFVRIPSSTQVRNDASVHERYANSSLDPGFVSGLPREPVALKRALLARWDWSETGAPDTFGLVIAIAEIYKFWVVPSDLSRSIWSMLSMEQGVTSLGRVDDRLGRTGEAFEYALPGGATASILIVSPQTGELLGFERVARDARAVGGLTVSEFTTIVSSSWEADSDDS